MCLAGFGFKHHLIISSSLVIFLIRSFPVAVTLNFTLCLYFYLKTGAQKCSLVKPRGIIHPSVLQVKKSSSILIHHQVFLLTSLSLLFPCCVNLESGSNPVLNLL